MKHYSMYINGEWFNTRNVLEVENPATKEIIASVPNEGSDVAKIAVNAAHVAFSTWSKTTAYERSEYLKNWFTLIEHNKSISIETGFIHYHI
ncbi:aldehyde dehydrogenase family protein [Rummeliibacillus sp. JY-2-4R]